MKSSSRCSDKQIRTIILIKVSLPPSMCASTNIFLESQGLFLHNSSGTLNALITRDLEQETIELPCPHSLPTKTAAGNCGHSDRNMQGKV